MEKKKLLLVAISTGFFLVISIVAAILIFSPKNGAVSPTAVASRPSASTPVVPHYQEPVFTGPGLSDQETEFQLSPLDPVDLVRNPEDVPGLRRPPVEFIREGTGIHVSGSEQSANDRGTETVINVRRPSAPTVPEAAPPAAPAPAAPAPAAPAAATPRPAAPTPVAAAPRPAEPAPTASRPAAPASPANRAAPQSRAQDDFWVQTGSFSTLSRAENVKESLASRGITSLIENREIEGRTLFRVRVGPYTSHNEANYWLSLIRSMDGFEGSLIMQTQRR